MRLLGTTTNQVQTRPFQSLRLRRNSAFCSCLDGHRGSVVSKASFRGRASRPRGDLPDKMLNTSLALDMVAAIRAVRLASHLCRTVQRLITESDSVAKKDDSPVTVADYGAQVLVAWALSQASMGRVISMVAEEESASLRTKEGEGNLCRVVSYVNSTLTACKCDARLTPRDILRLIDLGSSNGGPTGDHWVLDPIDGTRGFVNGRQYTVCLGLLSEGEVKLGVLGCPNLPLGPLREDDGGPESLARSEKGGSGCLFIGQRGCGSYMAPLWNADGAFTPIRVDESRPASSMRWMESFESRHSNQSRSALVAEMAGVVKTPLRLDSQAKYGLLARGEASIFMRFPPPTYMEKIWDHAAGVCIVEEAGGKVTDVSGAPLDFSRGRFLETMKEGIVAAPPSIHGKVLEAAKQSKST